MEFRNWNIWEEADDECAHSIYLNSSNVWAEAAVVDEAAEEFSDTARMLQIAEDICGPYVWKAYDLLVMPPSFPFGGMENPCLTFVTPTLLVSNAPSTVFEMLKIRVNSLTILLDGAAYSHRIDSSDY